MNLAIKILAAVLYLFALVTTVLKATRKVNYANEDWYTTVAFLLLFLALWKLRIGQSDVLIALGGAALVARLVFVALKMIKQKYVYELYNVDPKTQAEILGVVEAFNAENASDSASAVFSNKQPYRIEFKYVTRQNTKKLLRSINGFIREHAKTSVWTFAELALMLALGVLMVLWFQNVCLASLFF